MASFLATLCILTLLVSSSVGQDEQTSLWPPYLACTDKSLTLPSWTVKDFSIRSNARLPAANVTAPASLLGGNATVSFTLKHRVRNLQLGINCILNNGTCPVAKKVGVLSVNVQATNTNAQISLNTSWVCRDKRDFNGQVVTIPFTAVGHGSFHLEPSTQDGFQTWKPRQDLILLRGSITEPIQLDMAPQPAGSSASTISTCVSRSPVWKLENIGYYCSAAARKRLGPDAGGSMNMIIVNVPANETVSCLGVFPHDNSTSTSRKFQCWRDSSAPRQEPYGVGQLWTTVNFDERSFKFSVKQTWYCVDPISQTTTKLTAISNPQVLNLSCSDTLCTGGGQSVASNTSTVENLPPFSIIDPRPVSGGCTSDSMTKPSWTFSELDVKFDNATVPPIIRVGFNLQVNSAGYKTSVRKTFNASDPPVWADCGELEPKIPLCKLQFDPMSNRVSVKEQWICDDKSNFRQIVFNGTASIVLPQKNCTASPSYNITCNSASASFATGPDGAVNYWNL